MAKIFQLSFNLHDWFEHEKFDLEDDLYIYPKSRLLFSFLTILILLWGIFILWSFLFGQNFVEIDLYIENLIQNLRTPAGDTLFSFITFFGSQYFIIGSAFLLAIPLFIKHRKKAAVIFIFTLLITLVLVVALKSIFGRTRPLGCINNFDCFSYPSGHAALAFYYYGIISYLSLRFLKLRRKWRSICVLGVSVLVILIAVSRLYLGFHFLTDIVAGFLLGGICWLTAAIAIDLFYRKYL